MMDQPDLNEIYGKYVCWWASMMNLITLNGLDLAARMNKRMFFYLLWVATMVSELVLNNTGEGRDAHQHILEEEQKD